MPEIEFDEWFKALTGLQESESPFPWQQKLFEEFVQKRFRSTCDIPTGLGKTAVIAVWLLALAHHASHGTHYDFPRRLVYVVNRRTVVDQSTQEAVNMREALDREVRLKGVKDALQSLGALKWDNPLAISTLRGEMADNGEWRDDPARPAIIVGTVDMIGSRLLFSGYGRGFRSRPLHAAFLGQDTLLVHDEAHLEPAFQELIEAITKEQERCNEFLRMRVMAMTATARSDEDAEPPLFTDKDREHVVVDKRINAKKRISFHPVEEKKIAGKIANLAIEYKDSEKAILIYARTVKDVIEIEKQLSKNGLQVQKLTGTLRGLERDELAKNDSIFKRFMPTSKKSSSTTIPQPGTVYLICTSAGEVGVNISGDRLVCDLTPFDSMAQRFGRVNRFGNEDSKIDIVYDESMNSRLEIKSGDSNPIIADSESQYDGESKKSSKNKGKELSPLDLACLKTLHLLQKLPKYDDNRFNASPAALSGLPALERLAAFTPQPIILPTSDILFDSWSLTSVRQTLPGRPDVADWLHGVVEREISETHVAWREEVSIITGDLLERYDPEGLLDKYPLKAHELLRDRTDKVFENIEKIAERYPDLNAWLVQTDRRIRVISLKDLVQRNRQKKPMENIANCTVILPPNAGGFSKGFLQGEYEFDNEIHYDVSDQLRDLMGNNQRLRKWDPKPPEGMKLINPIIDIFLDTDDEYDSEEPLSRRYWYWFAQDSSRMTKKSQELTTHHQSAETFAGSISKKLRLNDEETSAVTLAACWHDLGKNREIWQHSIGNLDYPQQILAKSNGNMNGFKLSRYRHEFGSLLDIINLPEFKKLNPEMKDLTLHLIAAHHGRARPHFTSEEAFDHKHTDIESNKIACEVPRRFGRLQRKYGRWGLAYLESLVRAADALASQSNDTGKTAKSSGIIAAEAQ
ncbi:MAG: type I-U CRISPR-associated helicase/endonuclease Cas3 [Methanothrix sp.]|jgi:CRISPR-associated endonuclease/helicase Cas3|nr:type I-U CRISPR-associated helicase/endonuclease Cas3 [Methanothrix sp.]